MMNAITKALDLQLSSFAHSQETISFTSEILTFKLKLNKKANPKNICKELFKILYPVPVLRSRPYLAALFDLYFTSVTFAVVLLPAVLYFQLILPRDANRSHVALVAMTLVMLLVTGTFMSFLVVR